MIQNDNQHLWDRFIRLGDMLGDGDYEPWVAREYKKLLKILCPPTPEEKARKAEIRRNIDKQLEEKLKTDKCFKCNSNLKQTRKGSKVVQCINEECKARYQYRAQANKSKKK